MIGAMLSVNVVTALFIPFGSVEGLLWSATCLFLVSPAGSLNDTIVCIGEGLEGRGFLHLRALD